MTYSKIALYEYFEADASHSTVSPVTLAHSSWITRESVQVARMRVYLRCSCRLNDIMHELKLQTAKWCMYMLCTVC